MVGRNTIGVNPHVEVRKNGSISRWEVTELDGVPRPRKLWTVTGLGHNGEYGVHNNNLANVRRGLEERVLYRIGNGCVRLPALPSAEVVRRGFDDFAREIWRVMPVCRPITRDQFVSSYVGRKRAIYQKAADSLSMRPLNLSDSFLSTFVKCEKINFSVKPDPAPRVIQPRSPRYNVEVGRYLKRLEKPLCKGIADVWGGSTVLKGLNPDGVANALREMWDEFEDPVAIPTDATRFDQHVNSELLKGEHHVYHGLFHRSQRPKLQRLLEMQLENRGFARCPDGMIKYAVSGRRMSGDMNTGMGNCLIMCTVMWTMRQILGVRFRLANNGDDCVIICERRDATRILTAIPGHFLPYGLVLEVEPVVDKFELISFCQTQPVHDGDHWTMVRDPRVCVDKDLCTIIDLGTGAQKWAHAVGTCGLAIAGGLPMVQELYYTLQSIGVQGNVMDDPSMDSGFKMMASGSSRKYGEPTPEARASYWRAFGILPDKQTAAEEVWRAAKPTLSAGERESPLFLLHHG